MEEGVRIVSVNLGDLGSGVAGTDLVAFVTIGYTEVREARRRVRLNEGRER